MDSTEIGGQWLGLTLHEFPWLWNVFAIILATLLASYVVRLLFKSWRYS